jgi:hypothetical protein
LFVSSFRSQVESKPGVPVNSAALTSSSHPSSELTKQEKVHTDDKDVKFSLTAETDIFLTNSSISSQSSPSSSQSEHFRTCTVVVELKVPFKALQTTSSHQQRDQLMIQLEILYQLFPKKVLVGILTDAFAFSFIFRFQFDDENPCFITLEDIPNLMKLSKCYIL